MANVLLTEKCVRSCPYCFAKKQMGDSDEQKLKWDDLIYIADLHEATGDKAIALLGGEPTLHPDFTDYVLYLLERGFHVNVFTSGIMSDNTFEETARTLTPVHPERLSFVCNVNDPELSPFPELENVRRFLKVFGHLTVPGFNIYRPDFSIDFIFQYINLYGLKRHIRLGLAHPIPGTHNQFLELKDMKDFASKLISYLPVFERLQIKIGFDCGFPMCLFSDEEIGKLYKVNSGQVRFTCGPAIDIGSDMTVWSCFPLSNYHKKPIYDFDSIRDIGKFYEDRHQAIRAEVGGIFEECDDCAYRRDRLCHGGCIAHLLSKFNSEPRIRMKEVYNE